VATGCQRMRRNIQDSEMFKIKVEAVSEEKSYNSNFLPIPFVLVLLAEAIAELYG
jgi:hypothetical protein